MSRNDPVTAGLLERLSLRYLVGCYELLPSMSPREIFLSRGIFGKNMQFRPKLYMLTVLVITYKLFGVKSRPTCRNVVFLTCRIAPSAILEHKDLHVYYSFMGDI